MHPNRTMRPGRVACACEICGTVFYMKPSAASKARYCGRDCRGVADSAKRKPLSERFWPKVEKADDCWLWTGLRDIGGYGLIYSGGSDGHHIKAHRAAWELAGGTIPDGFIIGHTCDIRLCVRNDDEGIYRIRDRILIRRGHLFLGTHQDNMDDMAAKGRSSFTVHPESAPRGSTHKSAKLTEQQVVEIRRRAARGERLPALAATFGVTSTAIRFVVTRKNWAHVT